MNNLRSPCGATVPKREAYVNRVAGHMCRNASHSWRRSGTVGCRSRDAHYGTRPRSRNRSVSQRQRSQISFEKRLDRRHKGALILEQKRMAGIGVEHELCSLDLAGDDAVVHNGIELILGAVGDEGW